MPEPSNFLKNPWPEKARSQVTPTEKCRLAAWPTRYCRQIVWHPRLRCSPKLHYATTATLTFSAWHRSW